jgi:hypothetical protein
MVLPVNGLPCKRSVLTHSAFLLLYPLLGTGALSGHQRRVVGR